MNEPRPSAALPRGFLTITLHAHLPYVVNHGTWPHGMEWLHEAAAETYLPLLRVLARLERDGIALPFNLNLSPVLCEQLTHPVFLAEFPRYLARKSVAAREDEAFFAQSGEQEYVETARFWQGFYREAAENFEAWQGNLVAAFRSFADRGRIEIMTCAATHGYLPLLGTDESVRAQIRVAVQTHTRHFGRAPRGIWLPECGYRPAGSWRFPTTAADGSQLPGPGLPQSEQRIGVEQALAESELAFTFVDSHLVEASQHSASPYGGSVAPTHPADPAQAEHSLYVPYLIDGPAAHDGTHAPVAIFPRDPRTGLQVWSAEHGYPGDGNYVDFHKKRWPGGHRYWRVTGPHVSQEDKQPYRPQEAAARVQAHALHFVALVGQALAEAAPSGQPPILCSPFDAELFGHWWFEGPLWLEAVARALHADPAATQLISAADYLARYPHAEYVSLPEGSWGAGGDNQVWLNPETGWTYTHLYPAELTLRTICTGGHWRTSGLGTEIVQQLCRELLLLESSDWQFLITTGAARDYAELRFLTHHDQFQELKRIWEAFETDGALDEHNMARLKALQERDGLFPDIDPSFWATSSD